MILLAHIVIALTSIVLAGVTYIRPSRAKLTTSYILAGATLASGTYLIIGAPSHFVSACATGFIYLGIVLSFILAAQRKLARIRQEQTIS